MLFEPILLRLRQFTEDMAYSLSAPYFLFLHLPVRDVPSRRAGLGFRPVSVMVSISFFCDMVGLADGRDMVPSYISSVIDRKRYDLVRSFYAYDNSVSAFC